MNQILVTGEEYRKQPKKQTKKQKSETTKTVLGVNTIVIFFAISIIVLGLCMISGSVYAKTKINETVESNAKPTIEVIRNDENNTIEINVKHIRGIVGIAYGWNIDKELSTIGDSDKWYSDEETVTNGNNQTELKTEIDLMGGTNTLTVRVKEENGQIVSYQKTFTAGNIPEIKLQAISNGVKIQTKSENGIDYISYKWDNNQAQKVEVGEKEYEGTINVPKGKHTLTIEVVDLNGNKGTKTETVVGDTEPTLNLKAERKEDGKIYFIIDAEDDELIEKVEITFNGEEETINPNEKTFHKEIKIEEGEENKLKVVVYNINGLQAIKGGKI